ncbi:ABC transporter permease [Flavivirga aquimarina]|uniref:ABC transporter permease n=1 Tax=Flavivirga aquimarina TaxID=2027862 RepID=A0ABT8WCI9_9FLAO|nr:ABC transporter permease [Flavivirga aquimarina]MDO5970848.1 ABC transporter permease [Flavivirga aquimarina]
MIRNYIKIAWRNLIKNKAISSINIIGLAIGIASCLLIVLFVLDELSYDRFNERKDEVFRVVFRANVNGELIKEAVVMPPVAQTLKQEFPEVVDATRFKRIPSPKVSYEKNNYRNGKFAYVDPNFFDVFTLPIIKGNKVAPLDKPNTIVLTKNEAIKYFGKEDPIGKILLVNDLQFEITAIIDNMPNNSHFHFDMLASMVGYSAAKNTSWMNSGFYTYLVLKKGLDYKSLESKFSAIIEKYMGPQMKEETGMTFAEFTKDNQLGLFLQPLTDIHLNSDFSSASTLEQGGDMKSVYIFCSIALFMLLIACVNFMNLSTASATKRAKEVGVRKVLGSKKSQLIGQFLTEAFFSTAAAMLLAVILIVIMLPFFNNLFDKELQMTYLLEPQIVFTLVSLLIVISLLAGVYPAFYIASFKPIAALKSKFLSTGNKKGVRSGLVVFQFVISAGLILATLIVDKQMTFIQNKDIGYNKKQLLVLRESYFLGPNQTSFKNQILTDPRVERVTSSGHVPAGVTNNSVTGIYVNQKFDRRVNIFYIDDEYIPTMGMKLIEGRNFSNNFGADSLNIIVNETTINKLGYGSNPIGKTMIIGVNDDLKTFKIIGVVKDFHFRSLHQKIEPLIMLNKSSSGLIVRAKGADMSGLITSISKLWNNYQVNEPFTYTLLDDSYNETYMAEQRMGTILKIFAILTIFIACLGLFGLVTFTTEQRFKEIGVRKVLGSTVSQIVLMISEYFIKLVMVSFAIAFPLGYYSMNIWLQDFAYRTKIEWPTFLIAGFITICIAFITISFRSIKAAQTNPIKSLRTE